MHGLATVPLAALLAAAGAGCSGVTYSQDFDREVRIEPAATWAWQPLTADQEQALADVSPFLQRRIRRAIERELAEKGFTYSPDVVADYSVSAYARLPEPSRRVTSDGALSEYDVRRPVSPATSVRFGLGFGVGFGHAYRFASPYDPGWGYGFWPVLSYWNPYSWYLPALWGWGRPYFGYLSYGWQPFYGYGLHSLGGFGRPAVIDSDDSGPETLVIAVIDAESGEIVWQGLARGALREVPSGDELEAHVDRVVRRTLEGFPPGT